MKPYWFFCPKSILFVIPNYFSRLFFHFTGTQTLLLISTSSELYSNYFLLLNFTLSFLYLTQLLGLPVAPYHSLCSTSVTCGMSCHAIGPQMLLNFHLRELEGIPRDSKYPTDMPLLTCLVYLPLKIY